MSEDSRTSIRDSVFEFNGAVAGGGAAIYADSSLDRNEDQVYVEIIDSTFHQNEAGDNNNFISGETGGGGLDIKGTTGDFSKYIISGSTFSNNTSLGQAGGIRAEVSGDLQIINSTISGNQSNATGGGIYIAGRWGEATISHSTIVFNTVGFDDSLGGLGSGVGVDVENAVGGGLAIVGDGVDGSTKTTLDHTIVTDNLDSWDNDLNPLEGNTPDIHIVLSGTGVATQNISTPYSLVGSVTGGHSNPFFGNPGVVAAVPVGGMTVATANLGPLQDNGGPTKTHMPNANSVAIDNGNPAYTPSNYPIVNGAELKTDQRGFNRIVDIVGVRDGGSAPPLIDIGAVEVHSLAPHILDVVISSSTSTHAPTVLPTKCETPVGFPEIRSAPCPWVMPTG